MTASTTPAPPTLTTLGPIRIGTRASLLAIASATVAVGCGGDFDTSRSTPPRGTLGQELFSMICDRVGAQALQELLGGCPITGR